MGLFSLPKDAKFSNKYMVLFVLPVIFENLMLGLLGVVDTFMVSSLGEVAVAGVGLVNRIDNFAKQFFIALGMGGSVVLAQYIGAKNKEKARRSLENNIIIVTLIGIFVMLVMMIFKSQILSLLYGNAQKEVLEKSFGYFSVTALSYPFTALYYACNAQFRVMGRNKILLIGSVCMMTINLILKYIFIYVLKMDVEGAKFYTKHILKLDYVFTIGFVIVFLILLKPLVSIFNVSPDAKTQAIGIMTLYSIASATLYPSSFALPSALRGAGDTRFVMVVASASMFLFRIGAAYIFVHAFKLGVMGAWVAMVSDWIVRTIIFAIRFKNEKWTHNRVI